MRGLNLVVNFGWIHIKKFNEFLGIFPRLQLERLIWSGLVLLENESSDV
jgi:hypothetical protein